MPLNGYVEQTPTRLYIEGEKDDQRKKCEEDQRHNDLPVSKRSLRLSDI